MPEEVKRDLCAQSVEGAKLLNTFCRRTHLERGQKSMVENEKAKASDLEVNK